MTHRQKHNTASGHSHYITNNSTTHHDGELLGAPVVLLGLGGQVLADLAHLVQLVASVTVCDSAWGRRRVRDIV